MTPDTGRDPSKTSIEPSCRARRVSAAGPQGRALVREWLAASDDMLADATFLLKNKRSPRSVINRAYFAVVYAVRALLAAKGIDERQPDNMFARFEQIYVKTNALPGTVSEIVQAVFELRVDNDYALVVPSGQPLATGVLQDAETFLEAAKLCLSRLAGVGSSTKETVS